MIRRENINGKLISLCPLEVGDVDVFYEAVKESTLELSSWFLWCPVGYNRNDAEKFINSRLAAWNNGEEFDFMISDIDSHKFIGVIGLNRVDMKNRFANIGYWIRKGATGKGYATAALKIIAEWGLRELKLNRVEVICVVENISSIRVAEKAGFVREGVLRSRVILDGIAHDAVMLAMVREGIDQYR